VRVILFLVLVVWVIINPYESAFSGIPALAERCSADSVCVAGIGNPTHNEQRELAASRSVGLSCEGNQRVLLPKWDWPRLTFLDHYTTHLAIRQITFVRPFHRQAHLICDNNQMGFHNFGLYAADITDKALANDFLIRKQQCFFVPLPVARSVDHDISDSQSGSIVGKVHLMADRFLVMSDVGLVPTYVGLRFHERGLIAVSFRLPSENNGLNDNYRESDHRRQRLSNRGIGLRPSRIADGIVSIVGYIAFGVCCCLLCEIAYRIEYARYSAFDRKIMPVNSVTPRPDSESEAQQHDCDHY